jgi:uncharacterized protein (DUF2141 family)
MKTILTLAVPLVAGLVLAAPVGSAMAQQTGRVPVPPPARPSPGGTVVQTPPIPDQAPTPTEAAPSSVRPSAIPMPTQRPSASVRPQQTTVLLEIETARPEGRIAIAIYRDTDSFRHNRNPVRTMILDRSGTVTRAYVQGLTPGRYAIAAFQDIDGDGQLGKGAFGLPREPFGFSNDARGRFGPPTFDAAAFTVSASGTTQRIILRNPMNAILR